MDIKQLTLKETIDCLRNKSISSKELTNSYLESIKTKDPLIQAFVSINEDVIKEAEKADISINEIGNEIWDKKPLLGVPIAVKDNFSVKGMKTTASARVLENYISPYDSTVVKRLKDAGALILGKTNMDAWAHGSSTEYSDFFTTKNPWNIKHLPGGSSGGSAAAVAAGEAVAAIGSETAGSVRQPAAWCGVTGFKPTYGRVSRYGVVAMASSLDSPGPITKTVEDAQILLSIISGKDEHDATTIDESPLSFLKSKPIKGLKLGLPSSYFDNVDKEVSKMVMEGIKILEKMGVRIVDIDLLAPKYSVAVYTILQRSEVSSNLARYDGIRFGEDRSKFGDEAKRRIMLGTYTLSAGYFDQYYQKAQKVRTLIINDFEKTFENIDIILSPTSPTTALELGATEGQFMFGELQDYLVEPSSLAGLPGISVPCGFDEGLPIGMQLIGPVLSEELLASVARGFQEQTDWHKKLSY